MPSPHPRWGPGRPNHERRGNPILAVFLVYTLALRRAARTPLPILSVTIVPLAILWMLDQLFGGLPGALRSFPTRDYLTFSVPAVAVAAGLPFAMWCGAAIGRDAQSRFIDLFLTAPIARALIGFGAASAGATGAGCSALLVLIAGRAAGVTISGGIMGALGVVVLAGVMGCLYAAAAWFITALIADPRTGAAWRAAVLICTLLICDLLIPSNLLPGWLREAREVNPLSTAIDGARAVVWSRPDWQEWTRDLSGVCALAIVALIAAAALPGPRRGEW
jgi:ABC-type multidrug transport system permease subunit